jgi:CheY-like chemotaxis protein
MKQQTLKSLSYALPKMNGFELYVKIREKEPKVKVCFLTASEFYYENFRKKYTSELVELLDREFFIQNQSKMKI